MSKIGQDTNYIYNITSTTLGIYSYNTEEKGAYLNSVGGFKNLYVDEDNVYIGTTNSGVLYLDKNNIIFDISTPTDLTLYSKVYKQYPELTSNNIRDSYGKDGFVSFCTSSGVDFFKFEPNGYRSQVNTAGTYNSYIYSERELYYTVSGTAGWEVHKADPIVDWVPETFVSYSNSKVIRLVNDIYDFKVTKNTEDQTIVFLATDIGVVIINQDEDDYFCINTR